MHSNREILELLLQAIKEQNLTEKQCLLDTGINTSFFSDWKSRRFKNPSQEKVIKLANYLKLSLDDLFLGIEQYTTLTEEEKHWLELYQETPPDKQPQLLAIAQAFYDYMPTQENFSTILHETKKNIFKNNLVR